MVAEDMPKSPGNKGTDDSGNQKVKSIFHLGTTALRSITMGDTVYSVSSLRRIATSHCLLIYTYQN